MPMDQALEKAYNEVSKGPGGVIGITKNKAAVAKWNIIKHNKMLVTQYLRDYVVDDDETSLHHKFSPTITITEEEHVSEIVNALETDLIPLNIMKKERLS